MASKSNVIYTDRDRQTHRLLALTPLDTRQLLAISQTFAQPFTSERKVRRRMQQHQAAGWTKTFSYATISAGQLNYYKLTQAGYKLLNGPEAVLPKQSFFRTVSPALQRHTRHLADVIVRTNVAASELGVEIDMQHGENQQTLLLGDRSLKPDFSFRLRTRDGDFQFYDELDESTEPICSTKQRESLEAKIRFHEDYQNATGDRYRVRMIFANAGPRMRQFLVLARSRANRQRCIFYAGLLDDFLDHALPLTSPIFRDHFNRMQSVLPASISPQQMQMPSVETEKILSPTACVC